MSISLEKRREYDRRRYAVDPRMRERNRTAARVRHARNRILVDGLKDVPCVDCGGRFPPYCMDFHHRDPEAKDFEIARRLNTGFDKLQAEADKCDVLCSNCHRIRHWAARVD